MLAQLLIQFQKPIIVENALQNSTNQLELSTNDTFSNYANSSVINRMKRNVPNVGENAIPRESDHLPKKEHFLPPFADNGKIQTNAAIQFVMSKLAFQLVSQMQIW